MARQDLHVHTTFCDGKHTPEEMVRAALAMGLGRIGFTAHSYTFFDESYCLQKDAVEDYRREIARLKAAYAGRIEILCGVEQEYHSTFPTHGFDYAIGSVHYLKTDRGYFPVDESPEAFATLCEGEFGGDYYAMAEAYFATVADVLRRTGGAFVGHFDLITKFNQGGRFFDESHPRYVAAWQAAAESLLPWGKPFEINTGAMSRGYREEPYPSRPILRYIGQRGGRFLLSGDTHSADSLCYGFDECEKLAKELGLTLVGDGFRP